MFFSLDKALAIFTKSELGLSINKLLAITSRDCLSFLVREMLPDRMRSWLRAVFEPSGGQTVTAGKPSSEMGWVEIEVSIGEACQST